jgi:hypothetical protein
MYIKDISVALIEAESRIVRRATAYYVIILTILLQICLENSDSEV